MSRFIAANKRDREARRDRRKQDKANRLQRNRDEAARQRSTDSDGAEVEASRPPSSPLVDLAEVVIAAPAQLKREPLVPARLFVGGLSEDTTADQLWIAFSNFGKVSDARLIRDKTSGLSRGFGFVTFERWADADDAIKQMHDRDLDGRRLKVNRAEPS